MAGKTTKGKAWRTLITLFLAIAVLYGVIAATANWSDGSFTPKLALDLEGGTEIVLTPVLEGGKAPTSAEINQAIGILRQRIDAAGVSEAEITSQGGSNIVVALPGHPSEETLKLVRQSAQMRFRPVLRAEVGYSGASTANTTWMSYDAKSASPTPTPSPTASDTGKGLDPSGNVTQEVTDAMSFDQVSDEVKQKFNDLNCLQGNALVAKGGEPADQPLVTCSQDGGTKYILGPVEIDGSSLKSANSGPELTQQGSPTGRYEVDMQFDDDGTKIFAEASTQMMKYRTTDPDAVKFWSTTAADGTVTDGTVTDVFKNPDGSLVPDRNHFAIVLDGLVISSPGMESEITNGSARITGSFTQQEAATLANQLSFGALPVVFNVQSEQQISATMGSEQLQKGLLAGLIGLLLVALYSLLQYRMLGFVTILALIIAAGTTYGIITLLSYLIGYRLSLPGVAGVIVSVGITADSFIVYFERIKDEIRDGRALTQAVDVGWNRARRTILASDFVSFLAAVVLYFLAVGGVRGFAFTLGLTTLVDLLIVFGFTHPVVSLLARTRFFGGGHPASGLDPHTLGAEGSVHYKGRGQFATVGGKKDREDEGLSIAERRAREIERAALAAAPEPSIEHRPTSSTDEGGEN